MKYNHKNAPLNTPVYATAYLMDDEDLIAYLKCKPILGEVIDLERYKKEVGDNPPRFLRGTTQKYYIDGKWEERYERKPKNIFMPYRVGTKTFRKNGVACNSRDYADTYEEAVSLSKYIVSKCYQDDCPVTNIELQCLLYIIQRKFIACDLIAFFDDFEAWSFGAVIPNSYYNFCGFGAMPITHINYDINIEDKHKKFLDLIIETYRKYKPLELIDEVKIHNGAWETIYNNNEIKKKIIPIELIKKDAIARGEIIND